MNSLKKGFGQKVKELRKAKKYTQEVFAEMIDLSPRQLIRIENGENFPSAETLGKICLILKTHPKNFFEFTWDASDIHFINKNYNFIALKFIKSENTIKIEVLSDPKPDILDSLKNVSVDNYKTLTLNLSKKYDTVITVELHENETMKSIDMFKPNGKIETILDENDIKRRDFFNTLTEKLKSIPLDEEKMNYIKLAIDSLDDKNAREKLGCLIQGMKLVL